MDQIDSDHQLVFALQSGDISALEKLIALYQDKLIRFAATLGADSASAQDIVQQAFINAYQNINSFNSKYKFSSWIYRITHNLTINFFKKHHQKSQISLDFADWIQELIPGHVDLEAEAIAAEQKKDIKHSLQRLPLKYRSVVTLYYFEDKKYDEIADILHIPTNTVGVRLSRAKNMLKNLLKNHA